VSLYAHLPLNNPTTQTPSLSLRSHNINDIPYTIPPPSCAYTPILPLPILFIVIVIPLTIPPLSLQSLPPNSPAREKAQEGDAAEDSECQSLAFRPETCGGGEQGAGDERASGAAGGGEGLG